MAANEFIDFDNIPEISFFDYGSGSYEAEITEPENLDGENDFDDFEGDDNYPDFGEEDKNESSFDEEYSEGEEGEYINLLDDYFGSLDFEVYKEAE